MRSQKITTGLLASLQSTAQRGEQRLQRLENVLNSIAADSNDPERINVAFQTMRILRSDLANLQQLHSSFAVQLAKPLTRGEMSDIKKRLEAHQQMLGKWEERLFGELNIVSALQSPKARSIMARNMRTPSTQGT